MSPSDQVQRAHWGDFQGLRLAGLVRLSFELDHDDPQVVPIRGRDIRGRDEQEKDCRTYVESRGGSYVHTYVEPHTSAWKRKRVRLPDGRTGYRVIRPVFEAALEDLKRGKTPDGEPLDGLVVYDIDRLTRDNRHLEDAIEVVEHFGRPIIDITGTLDLLTDNGRTVARIVVATNNKQSADTARRVKRKHRALELAGIPTGGRRPFGWNDDKRTLRVPEAELIREAAQRIIKGAPLASVAVDWNNQAVTTALGNRWTNGSVKTVFRNPRLCGYRSRNVHEIDPDTGRQTIHVEIVRDADGNPVIGQFDPILTVAEWEAVTAILGNRTIASRGKNTRTYLLTGTLRCGKPECNARLRALKAHASRVKTPGRFYYSCPAKSQRGCGGGVSIPGPETDKWISAAVITKYEQEAQRRDAATEPEPWPQQAELAEVQDDLRELSTARKERRISAQRYFAMLPDLEQQEHALLADRERWLAQTTAATTTHATIRQDWDDYPLAQKRALIEEALTAVVVYPANGRRGFHPDRVELIWRG
ncbi:recombinase family protein [Labedaea rhizosphaerae]|uniref:DNA invertase Pin-like site-specific DNA recombinase n=1 Tax=Labedaea rhizosphaerae TaxID=598644 RepID=A0A4R6SP10_LABRH|nr:recombinase family protein [Labedaea rhizosphaerae]TDQ05909.1 DNA invertase Pin-like site-specific DNA recombinase [Labedaea rhizosphaerae]